MTRGRAAATVAAVAAAIVVVPCVDTGAAGAQGAAPRGTVVTDTLWSQALGTSKSLVVYLPPSYGTDTARRYPVAYYLHGATGDETNWTKLGKLDAVMDSLIAVGTPEMIIAMPDGDAYSYYTTYNVLLTEAGCRRLMLPPGGDAARDCVAWPHYDDYIAYDVVRHMDTKYRTFALRERRAIAGLSMGGYGAVTLALQYPNIFAAAASHSGVLFPLEWAPAPIGHGPLQRSAADSAAYVRMRAQSADRWRVTFGADSASWHARDPAILAARLVAARTPLPALFADCGTADFYLPQNRAFVAALSARGVPIAYREWPGSHSWTYWHKHVPESLSWIAARIAAPAPR